MSDSQKPVLEELELLRAQCKQLCLAVTAIGHEMRQGVHILLSNLNKCGISPHSRSEHAALQSAKELANRMTTEFESLATLAALAGTQAAAPLIDVVAIQPIVSGVHARWQFEARQNGISIRMTLNDINVFSNANWLGIMLNNVVGNAVRHSRVGEVSIEGRVEQSDYILVVRDNGSGISEEEMRRALDGVPPPRPNGQGLGLGLSIVRRAAELLRHDFGISSTPFRGTEVRLRMPMSNGEGKKPPLLAQRFFDAT